MIIFTLYLYISLNKVNNNYNITNKICFNRKIIMNDIKFNEMPDLGGVIKKFRPFCKLTKQTTVVTPEFIMGDFNNPNFHGLAGHKWSRLCGFTFESNIPNVSPKTFQFVYVPKLRGTMSRNDKALSGWYCWEVIASDHRNVISIDTMKNKYHFNINAFVHCDEFNKYIPLFISNITAALNGPVTELLNSITDKHEKHTLQFYVNAIKTSLDEIAQVKKYITYDDGSKVMTSPDDPDARANLAYNADKDYSLRNLDKAEQERVARKRKQFKDELRKAKPSSSSKAISTQTNEPGNDTATTSKIKFDPSLKHKFGGGRTRKQDAEIFDKYDDYDNDDYR